MDANCLTAPEIVAFIRTFGIAFGLGAAAFAWLLNRIVSWCVWMAQRDPERLELMKIIDADIGDTQRVEETYADVDAALHLIERLRVTLPRDAPLAPYVAVDSDQFGFEESAKEIHPSTPAHPRSGLQLLSRQPRPRGATHGFSLGRLPNAVPRASGSRDPRHLQARGGSQGSGESRQGPPSDGHQNPGPPILQDDPDSHSMRPRGRLRGRHGPSRTAEPDQWGGRMGPRMQCPSDKALTSRE